MAAIMKESHLKFCYLKKAVIEMFKTFRCWLSFLKVEIGHLELFRYWSCFQMAAIKKTW
jgi:hypothetical protein